MTDGDDKGFLGRWSRLKQQARAERASGRAGLDPGDKATGDPRPGADAASAGSAVDDPAPDAKPAQTEADFADFDFATLDASSDYTRFMGANVPDAIRQKALMRLWTSEPQFAGLDPLHDYHGDYTDAAVAVKEGLQTAYRVGRGFLSDEEVAAWENLGKPEKADGDEKKVAQAAPEVGTREVAQAEAQPVVPPVAVAAAAAADTASAPVAGQAPEPAAATKVSGGGSNGTAT